MFIQQLDKVWFIYTCYVMRVICFQLWSMLFNNMVNVQRHVSTMVNVHRVYVSLTSG